MDGIEMPVNFRTVGDILIAQKSKMMAANLLRVRHDLLCLLGQVFSEQPNPAIALLIRKEKITSRCRGKMQPIPRGLPPNLVPSDVEPFGDLLAQASLQFIPTHVGQARPESSSAERHTQILSSTSRYTPRELKKIIEA